MNIRNMQSNPDVWRVKEDIPLWKIGKKLGLSENTIIRWLRDELGESRKQQILNAIREIKADHQQGGVGV